MAFDEASREALAQGLFAASDNLMKDADGSNNVLQSGISILQNAIKKNKDDADKKAAESVIVDNTPGK